MSHLIKVDTTNIQEAMDIGDHDFEVEKVNLYTDNGLKIPDYVAVQSSDGRYLGTVGRGWEPVQPQAIYDLAQDLMDATEGSINGVINMFGGSIIGLSFNLAQREYVASDPVDLNFVMITSFNGTHGIAGHATSKRLSCLNQCNTSNKLYNLRHTKNVSNRLIVVKNILKYYKNEIKSFDDKMMNLVNTRMSDEESIEWFEKLFPTPKSKNGQTVLKKNTEIFADLLVNGRGSEIQGVRHTSYGAFQALTEYINHHKTTRIHNDRDEDEVRFQSIHFGSGNKLAQTGLSTILTDDFLFTENEFRI